MVIKFDKSRGGALTSPYKQKNYRLDFKTDKNKLFKSCIKSIEKIGYNIEEIDDNELTLYFRLKQTFTIDEYQFIVRAIKTGSSKSTLEVSVLRCLTTLGVVTDRGQGKKIADEIFNNIA